MSSLRERVSSQERQVRLKAQRERFSESSEHPLDCENYFKYFFNRWNTFTFSLKRKKSKYCLKVPSVAIYYYNKIFSYNLKRVHTFKTYLRKILLDVCIII